MWKCVFQTNAVYVGVKLILVYKIIAVKIIHAVLLGCFMTQMYWKHIVIIAKVLHRLRWIIETNIISVIIVLYGTRQNILQSLKIFKE